MRKNKDETVEPEVLETQVDTEPEEEELTEVEQLQATIKELETELKTLQNEYLKEQADLVNTKKRLEKERVIERKYAAMAVAKSFINPLDHFELALKHQPKDEETKTFVQGFAMILKEIKTGLESVGVSEIDALGEEYDPNFHQAVMTEKVDTTEANIVIEVLQKGYMFKERVIRPAMVKISE